MADRWRVGRLRDVATVNPSEAPLAPEAPFVPMDAVEPGARWPRYFEERRDRAGARARARDTIFSRITPCLENGKVAQIPAAIARCGGSTEFIVVRAGPVVDPDYLYVWATSTVVRETATRLMTGTTGRQRLAGSDLASMTIPVPPLAEQRRLVDLMQALDDAIWSAISYTSAARTAYQTLAREVLQSDVRTRLGEVVEVRMGRQRSPNNAAGPYMVPYLRAANVRDGVLEVDDVLLMNFNPDEQRTFALEPGDVLVTEGCGTLGQLGASGQWHGELPGVTCFQNTVIRLRPRNGLTEPGFVHHLARHAHHAGWWASIASGTNIFHIGSRRAERMEVPVPDVATQTEIGALLDDADEVVSTAEAVVRRLRTLRSVLLTDLLSGGHDLPASYDRFLHGAA